MRLCKFSGLWWQSEKWEIRGTKGRLSMDGGIAGLHKLSNLKHLILHIPRPNPTPSLFSFAHVILLENLTSESPLLSWNSLLGVFFSTWWNLELMSMAPNGDQIWNLCLQHHLVAKFDQLN